MIAGSTMVLNDGTLALHLIIAGALNANSHFQEQINTQAHRMATMTFKLHEFSTSKDITWQVDMDSGKLEELGYDMIIGRDLAVGPVVVPQLIK